MNFLENPWFVGIVGGILSGVAATWLSRFLFSKRDSREYAQKIAAVNREVIYSVRPGISEGNIPGAAVLAALISSTCRKYGVAIADAFSVEQISEELVKEVMDSSFISSATKNEYCARLLTAEVIARPEPTTPAIGSPALHAEQNTAESLDILRAKMLGQTSMITGVMVATLTLSLTVLKDLLERPFFKDILDVVLTGPSKDFLLPLLVLSASVVGMIAVPFANKVIRDIRIILGIQDAASSGKPRAKDA